MAASRHVERQADDFALRLTGNAPAFIAAMERLGALNLAETDPHPLKELLFYSHPSIQRRVSEVRRHFSVSQPDTCPQRLSARHARTRRMIRHGTMEDDDPPWASGNPVTSR